MGKLYTLLVLLTLCTVVVATVHIDIVIQEQMTQRWAVSGIASLMPDVEQSWCLYLFGYQFKIRPEETIEWLQAVVDSGFQEMMMVSKRVFKFLSQ